MFPSEKTNSSQPPVPRIYYHLPTYLPERRSEHNPWDTTTDDSERAEVSQDQRTIRSSRLRNALHAPVDLETSAARLYHSLAIVLSSDEVDVRAVPNALIRLGTVSRISGDYGTAEHAYTQALDTCSRIGDSLGVAEASLGLGYVYRAQIRYRDAETLFTQARDLYTGLCNDSGLAEAYLGLGYVSSFQSLYQDAEGHFDKARRLCARLRNDLGVADALIGLGGVYRFQAKYDKAEGFFSQAGEIFGRCGIDRGQADAFFGLGEVSRFQYRFNEAKSFFYQACDTYASVGDELGRADALMGLGHVYFSEGASREAEDYFNHAKMTYNRLGDGLGRADTLMALGGVYRLQNRYPEAKESFSEAAELFGSFGKESGQADALMGMGEVQRLLAQYSDAESSLRQAHDIYARVQNGMGQARASLALGYVYSIQAQYSDAEAVLLQASNVARDVGYEAGQADAQMALGEIQMWTGRYDKAENAFRAARDMFTRTGDLSRQGDASYALGCLFSRQMGHREGGDLLYTASDGNTSDVSMPHRACTTTSFDILPSTEARRGEVKEFFSDAIDSFIRCGNAVGRATALMGLGEAHRLEDMYPESEALFRKALDTYTSLSIQVGQADARMGLGYTYLAQRKYKDAETDFHRAGKIYADFRDDLGQANAIFGLGEVFRLRYEYGDAERTIGEARSIYTSLNNIMGWADTSLALGYNYSSQMDFSKAEESFQQARNLYSLIDDDVGQRRASHELEDVQKTIINRIRFNNNGIDDFIDGLEERLPGAGSPLPCDVGPSITSISSSPFSVDGHFGDLFEGLHKTIGKVALKRLRMGPGESEAAMRRSAREARIWRRARHPNILQFIGTYKRGSQCYLVSPFMKNGTLAQYIKAHPIMDRIKPLRETAAAIAYLHTVMVTHGDIKASNILINEDTSAMICDFGLAKTMGSDTSTGLKGTGSTQWMSPELFNGEPKTPESDVYAFAMTIAEVLTGQPPFPHLSNPAAVVCAIIQENRRPPKEPESSSEGITYLPVWEVADACWSRDPAERISMVEALRRLSLDPSGL